MDNTVKEPDKHISIDAVKVWRITNTIEHGVLLLIGTGLLGAGIYFEWFGWVIITLSSLLVFDILLAIWEIGIQPVLLQRFWRYDINSDYVQIKHGIFKVTQTVAPMTKVQYVTAEQGPILRKYGLYTIEVGTMCSGINIPAIPEQEALTLRTEIANYAKLKEVEDL